MASLVLDPFDHHTEGSARSGNSQQQSQEYSQQHSQGQVTARERALRSPVRRGPPEHESLLSFDGILAETRPAVSTPVSCCCESISSP